MNQSLADTKELIYMNLFFTHSDYSLREIKTIGVVFYMGSMSAAFDRFAMVHFSIISNGLSYTQGSFQTFLPCAQPLFLKVSI